MTKFGRSKTKGQLELFGEAAMDAINGSKLKPKDMQALFLGNSVGDMDEGQTVLASHAAREIGLQNVPATRLEGACSSSSLAMVNAYVWVASGFRDIVLVGGCERNTASATPLATRIMNTGPHHRYEGPTGITFPGLFAMMAHMYSHKYGVPLDKLKEAMATVAIKNHKNGFKNPKAHLRIEINYDDVYNSMMIAKPLQLYDCCPISDGASAAVIVSADVAKNLTDKPVQLIGLGQASAGGLSTQRDYTLPIARTLSAKMAYEMAGVKPQDIDVCELHDCFTIAEIVASEGLGFFEPGDGWQAVMRGDTQIGGKIPISASGGLKSKGHPVGATGTAQVYEIANQLRGECGERQVEGAKIGMTDTLGGPFASIVNIIMKRGW
jgi:acetyl-CoA C-acetyltransferase/acetyl-CoA acyltransferase